MYKLIVGNVRVTVEDEVNRNDAAKLAREAVAAAARQGKLLSLIEISAAGDVNTTERAVGVGSRKTLKQSMLDGVVAAARERLYPTHVYATKDSWLDVDTGQEWFGSEVDVAREEVMKRLEEWIKTV